MDLNFMLLIRAIRNEEERYRLRLMRRTLRDTSDPLTLPEGFFKSVYRCSRESAHALVLAIGPHLPDRERQVIALPDNLIILCALHFYAQGSYQKSVGQDFICPMSQASVSNSINTVTNILNNHFVHYVRFPTTEEEKKVEKRKFMGVHNGFGGIIGAIDCTHVKLFSPPINGENPGILFLNRKGYHSLNVQCIVAADLKLLAINARYPGSVHDSAIWSTSQIRVHLQNCYENGQRNFWLIGDNGYGLEPWLMTPVAARNQNDGERRYNAAHKSVRNVVERFNGVIKSRFRCCFAERSLHYSPEKAAKIVNACAILHNFLINRQDIIEAEQIHEHDPDDDDAPELFNFNLNILNEGRRVRERIINQYF